MKKLLHERLREVKNHLDWDNALSIDLTKMTCENAERLADEIERDYIPRQQVKVFDADGIEIKVGDILYDKLGREVKVTGFEFVFGCEWYILDEDNCYYLPSRLFHKKPDSFQQIIDDLYSWVAAGGFSFEILDIANRLCVLTGKEPYGDREATVESTRS